MNARYASSFFALISVFSLSLSSGEELLCGHHTLSLFAATNDPATKRQYAPSREIDIQHLALDITPDFNHRSIAGIAALTFAPIVPAFQELKLDAEELTVETVTSTAEVQAWQATESQLIVTFAQPLAPGRETRVTVRYTATPRKGLYFRTAELGYAAADVHLWTQGEPNESRNWFPSFDAPNEKFTSEVTCRVPDGMTVLSNGRQVSSTFEAASGLRAVRWVQDKPHVNYLIALAAGYFKGIEDKYRDLPIGLFTPASQIEHATNTFAGTKDMLAFFEEEIGVPYPWDKYYQVCVSDYHWGGMENTSLTILNESALFPSGFETLRSSEGLVAHELAHQWFGDLVTCKDWSHLWLNEGFATYYDALYQGHRHGREQMLYTLYESARGITGMPEDLLPVVHRRFAKPEEQFSFRAYAKGSWILHMLRHQLGEDLYRRCIKTFLERHRFGNVETEDLVRVIEELSGRSFDQFFDQYVYHAQQPNLVISYEWREREKLVKVNVTQNQKLSEDVLLFDFPATLRFRGKFGSVERTVTVQQKSEDFYFPLPQAPEIVRFDPELNLLAKVTFEVPITMLYAQLEDSKDVIGRFIAVEQLAKSNDVQTVAKLAKVLKEDPFYGVRIEASKALRQMKLPEAAEALQTSTNQPDARVRRQVLSDLVSPYRESSLSEALRSLGTEKNPDILATAILALGAYIRPEVSERLRAALTTSSYRGVLASAALSAITKQEDTSYVPDLLRALQENETQWPTSVFAEGLRTLAHSARFAEKRDTAREFILSHLDSRRERVQLAAIRALGVLGDPKAIAALEQFSGLPASDPKRVAGERAVLDLRSAKKPVVEFGDIRNQVLSLQQENRDLKKDLETLQKKLNLLLTQPKSDADKKAPAASPPKSRAQGR